MGQCGARSINLPNQQKLQNPPKILFPFFIVEFLSMGAKRVLAHGDQSFVLTIREELFGFGYGGNGLIFPEKEKEIRVPKKIVVTQKKHFVKHFSVSTDHILCVIEEESERENQEKGENLFVSKLYCWGHSSLIGEKNNNYSSIPFQINLLTLEPNQHYDRVFCAKLDKFSFNFICKRTGKIEKNTFDFFDFPLPIITNEMIDKLEFIYEGNLKNFKNFLQFVFTHPSLLNASFLGNDHYTSYKKSSGISMQLVRKFFISLMGSKHSNEFREILFSSSCDLINKLSSNRLCHCHESMRVFQILLESPVFVNPEYRKLKPLDQILFVIFELPNSLRNMLLEYIGNYDSTFFIVPLHIFQKTLSFVIPKLSSNPQLEEGIYHRSIFFLNNLNQVNFVHKIVPYQQFINPAISRSVKKKKKIF